MFNYTRFLRTLISRLNANETYESVKLRGTQTQKIRLLFDIYPSLKKRENAHMLIMAFWVAYDSTAEFGSVPNATPAESITRIRRYILEDERRMASVMEHAVS